MLQAGFPSSRMTRSSKTLAGVSFPNSDPDWNRPIKLGRGLTTTCRSIVHVPFIKNGDECLGDSPPVCSPPVCSPARTSRPGRQKASKSSYVRPMSGRLAVYPNLIIIANDCGRRWATFLRVATTYSCLPSGQFGIRQCVVQHKWGGSAPARTRMSGLGGLDALDRTGGHVGDGQCHRTHRRRL